MVAVGAVHSSAPFGWCSFRTGRQRLAGDLAHMEMNWLT